MTDPSPDAVPGQPAAESPPRHTEPELPATDPAPPGRSRGRRGRLLLVAAAAVLGIAVLVVGGSYAWVRIDSSGHRFRVTDAPTADVALVLGAGLRQDGTPSEYLRYRLDDAAALYAAGKAKVLLVSGDNRVADYDEPTAMQDYLVAAGVPRDRIVRDFAGQDTYDSCVRAKEIFGVTRALVVTQEFHLPRAVFLCRQAGIDADGVADEHRIVTTTPVLREIPAATKAAWDAIWQPDPRHLGPVEDDVAVALSR